MALAVRFFHIAALSSSLPRSPSKPISTWRLLVIASGLYRIMAHRMRGYDDAQARQIFHDLIDMPADLAITPHEVRCASTAAPTFSIVLASGLFQKPVAVPWWNGRSLRLVE